MYYEAILKFILRVIHQQTTHARVSVFLEGQDNIYQNEIHVLRLVVYWIQSDVHKYV